MIRKLLILIIIWFSLHAQFAQSQKILKPSQSGLVYDTNGEKYFLTPYHNGYATISKDGYLGLIDSTGTIVTPVKYNNIRPFQGNLAFAKLKILLQY